MPTAIFTVVPRNNTDAEFRAWGSALAAQFAAMGWVQTADTGQINWTTVLKPAAVNTFMGYEIWRMNDSLQATAPVFMRVDYGSSSNVLSAALNVTVGTGTNGAGVIDPGNYPLFAPKANGNSAVLQNCYISGNTNRLALAFSQSNTGSAFWFSIERSKDAAGQDTGDSLLMSWTDNGHTGWKQASYQIGVGSQGETGIHALMPAAGTGVGATDTAIYPLWFPRGPYLPFGLNALAYFTADIPALIAITATVYGATHTFLPLSTAFAGVVVAGQGLLLRWE